MKTWERAVDLLTAGIVILCIPALLVLTAGMFVVLLAVGMIATPVFMALGFLRALPVWAQSVLDALRGKTAQKELTSELIEES